MKSLEQSSDGDPSCSVFSASKQPLLHRIKYFCSFLWASHALNNALLRANSSPKTEEPGWQSLYKEPYLCHVVLASSAHSKALLGVFLYPLGKPNCFFDIEGSGDVFWKDDITQII